MMTGGDAATGPNRAPAVRVSVIIPVHDPGTFLEPALASVHSQTFQDWELILVDDASTEDLSWVVERFPRAQLTRQPHGGASIARNNGILRATGELIAFMDQDDIWEPGKLERQVDAMTRVPDAGLCYCDLTVFNGAAPAGADAATTTTTTSGDFDIVLMARSVDGRSPLHVSLSHFANSFIVPSTVMIRRACLATSGLLDPFIPFSGDFDLLVKLGSRHPVVHVRAVDVRYRKHDSNFSNRYDTGRAEVEALIDRYVSYAESQGDDRLAAEAGTILRRPRRLYAAQAFDCARASWRQRRFRDTAYHLWRTVRFSPAFAVRTLGKHLTKRRGG